MSIPIGIVGAGVWADRIHVPSILADQRFEIVGIWSRGSEKAARLATKWGVQVFTSLEDLIRDSQVLDFAVPPAIQPELALSAARRGKHLILEKPLGTTDASLTELNSVLAAQRLLAKVFVTRFFDHERTKLVRSLALQPWTRAVSTWRSNAYLPGSVFATEWRTPEALLGDIGPHVIAQLEAILGRVDRGHISRESNTTAEIELHHARGAHSQIRIDVGADVQQLQEHLTLWSESSPHEVPLAAVDARAAFGTLLDQFATDLDTGSSSSEPETGVAEGIRMVRLLEALRADSEQ